MPGRSRMLTVWSDAGVESQATSLHHDEQFAAQLGMTVVKGQHTDEKPMTTDADWPNSALDTLNDDLMSGMLPRRNNLPKWRTCVPQIHLCGSRYWV